MVDLHVVALNDDNDENESTFSSTDLETLSYVWGNPSQTEPITVSGVQFEATHNLAEFLRCLRLPNI